MKNLKPIGIPYSILFEDIFARTYDPSKFDFTGVKLFRTPEVLMKPLFGMTTGDIFSTDKLRKGIENMRKLYGKFGYIDFVPEPDFHPAPAAIRSISP
jgi:outer membrane protein assembly factor BamA